ncbi:hypothetical protein F5X99DRAFT_387665 [Biscogniauxia marginata]|nr:hypothetical protein F5X99DRAFT_387665 [Biscogniauxia marginata]
MFFSFSFRGGGGWFRLRSMLISVTWHDAACAIERKGREGNTLLGGLNLSVFLSGRSFLYRTSLVQEMRTLYVNTRVMLLTV